MVAFACSLFLGAWIATAPLQRGEPQGDSRHASRSTVLQGIVVDSEGLSALRALVTSSAGGRTLTAADGSFSLDVQVPTDADRVQVTAVLGAGRTRTVAKAAVAIPRVGSLTPAGVLQLGSSCEPSWAPTLGTYPGADGEVSFLEVLDDGGGPALYVGGGFTRVDDFEANGIARWDGESWSALGSGVTGGVHCAVVFDDGSGPALFVGGSFTTAGGGAANRVAKWDGTSWSALGSGTNDTVLALAVFDDGGGPALYAGGQFTTAGGGAANRIAKWDGTTWSALGSGTNGTVHALLVFDSGGGPKLHVGGAFGAAGGLSSTARIARWNGASWSSIGSSLSGTVHELASYDEGSGPRLFAAGTEVIADSLIARWNGSVWSQVGGGLPTDEFVSSWVSCLSVIDDGSGPALFAGGYFWSPGDGIAKWNGSSWSSYGPDSNWNGEGIGRFVEELAFFDDGGTDVLFVGGFSLDGATGFDALMKWTATTYVPLGDGLDNDVSALTVWDDGNGPALYVGSYSTFSQGDAVLGISRWDGTTSAPLATGFRAGVPKALAVFDDGGGEALFAGGSFNFAGGVLSPNLARWNGSAWSAVTGAPNNDVLALAAFDDGSGPALFAGGSFTSPGSRIARWNGTTWSALGTGMTNTVRCLIAFDDGSGPALYAGGSFGNAGGVTARGIARWNGTSWSAVGSGIIGGGHVYALAVWDDGNGPALYMGGSFGLPGFGDTHLAKWNGVAWAPLGSPVSGEIFALASFDDGMGGGPALFAGGNISTAGGNAVNDIARWDGTSWSALGSGVNDNVLALGVFDDGSPAGAALYVGGAFDLAPDSGDAFLARWQGCDLVPPELTCPENMSVIDKLGSSSGEVVFFTVTASDNADPEPSVVCVPPSGSLFPQGTTIVNCTATDASGNESSCDFTVRVLPKYQQKQL